MNQRCRFCDRELTNIFVDLGMSPVANDYVAVEKQYAMEPFFPLCVYVCDDCLLVQLPAVHAADDIFRDDYAYFSSMSDSWLAHAKSFVDMAVSRFSLDESSLVTELASNDGYLLQYFGEHNVPVLGVEPCGSVADAAIEKGIRTVSEFFGVDLAMKLAAEEQKPDLIIGNNVLAHVPDINDFVGGMKSLLASGGTITMEFPHLMRLMEFNQFDTIYHEHFSYFTLTSVSRIFIHHGLRIFDVEELPTHGGSLRIFACHKDDQRPNESSIEALRAEEARRSLDSLDGYGGFEEKVFKVKRDLLRFLIDAKESGKTVVGYGAPAKGNTLLNFCGVRTDLIEYTVDRAPSKQNCLLPGTRIPIHAPEKILETKPDYILILPWNISAEIVDKMSAVRDWGGKFAVPIPGVCITD